MKSGRCPIHHVPMEIVPAEPISRCPNCHYMTHHLQFVDCPECGRRLQIEEPDPEQRCPLCEPSDAQREETTARQ